MLALISSLYHSGHTGHYCPDVLGPLLCCSIKQLGYYVLNWLVLLLIMPSCCKGGWMATHLTCINTVFRTQQPTISSIQQSVSSVNIQLVGIVLDVLSIKYNFIWIGSIVSSPLKMYPRPPIQFSSNEKMFESQH